MSSSVVFMAYPVYAFQRGQVGVVKVGDKMVLQGGFYHPSLVVIAMLLLVLSEEALILPGRRSCWDGCRSSRVGRADEGGVRDVSVLLGQKDEPKVAILASAEVALVRRLVRRQELIYLLDDGVFGITRVLGG